MVPNYYVQIIAKLGYNIWNNLEALVYAHGPAVSEELQIYTCIKIILALHP